MSGRKSGPSSSSRIVGREMATRRKPTGKATSGNGHGGARAGAGRKRDVVPREVMERVGDLPPRDKPLQIANWWQGFLGELAVYHATTGKCGDLAIRMSKLSTASMRAMPLDAIREALVLLELDTARLKDSNTGPKEHDAGESGARALRRCAP